MNTHSTPVHAPGSPLGAAIETCTRVAASDATVLLTGETGTGKEVFARLVHENSARRRGHFVAVNCGAIPEALFEAELFGHARGAFTGAAAARKGRVALAEGGTLFLDEIGELPLAMQVKLLRLLQERTYEPVGDSTSVHADVRLVAATNCDLEADVAAGRFRKDLYYRLFVCPVHLPALRERGMDVPALFEHFWRARGERRPIDPSVLEALSKHRWPGNVRELENVVERLAVCATGETIELRDLPPFYLTSTGTPSTPAASAPRAEPGITDSEREALFMSTARIDEESMLLDLPRVFPLSLPNLLRTLEEQYIDRALEATSGNRQAAATLLGLQRTTLVEKLRRREQNKTWPPAKPDGPPTAQRMQ